MALIDHPYHERINEVRYFAGLLINKEQNTFKSMDDMGPGYNEALRVLSLIEETMQNRAEELTFWHRPDMHTDCPFQIFAVDDFNIVEGASCFFLQLQMMREDITKEQINEYRALLLDVLVGTTSQVAASIEFVGIVRHAYLNVSTQTLCTVE
jgi:hypothetical protein